MMREAEDGSKFLLDTYLQPKYAKSKSHVCRAENGTLVLASEKSLDFDKLRKNGVPLGEVARRFRVYSDDFQKELATWLAPYRLMEISDGPTASELGGTKTPLGNLVFDHGLYLKYEAGLEEVGMNDRGEVILRRAQDPKKADPTVGPVANSSNTIITGRAKRLVTRLVQEDHKRDIDEAKAWLQALQLVGGKRNLTSKFACAGIQYTHRGNVPYLHRTTQINFFQPKDPSVKKLSKAVESHFHKIRRKVPKVNIFSMVDLPKTEKEYKAFLTALKRKKGAKLVQKLPERLRNSQFWDPEAKQVVSSNFLYFCPLSEIKDSVTIITVNTDYHGEVKSRGVLSPLMAIMSLINVISAHAGSAVLNRRGTATTFTGPTGTGKTTAGTFFAEKNERYRRLELRRRYEIDLVREKKMKSGSKEIEKELDSIMKNAGILCQEDWIEIMRVTEGKWIFWPTERACYARTGGFPGLKYVLEENAPLVENVNADFGAAGTKEAFGTITHDFFPERIFYDPDWEHIWYDREPRPLTANVFLERDKSLDFVAKRVSSEEAIRWLLIGRTPQGKYEPLYNAYPDFSGLLITFGIVEQKLLDAYEAGKEGDYTPLGNGDPTVGKAVFEKLHTQVKLWLTYCQDTPTYIVNGAPGLEITQDINWALSEYPELFDQWSQVTEEDFKEFMKSRYGVTYGPKGNWTHLSTAQRRGEEPIRVDLPKTSAAIG